MSLRPATIISGARIDGSGYLVTHAECDFVGLLYYSQHAI